MKFDAGSYNVVNRWDQGMLNPRERYATGVSGLTKDGDNIMFTLHTGHRYSHGVFAFPRTCPARYSLKEYRVYTQSVVCNRAALNRVMLNVYLYHEENQ